MPPNVRNAYTLRSLKYISPFYNTCKGVVDSLDKAGYWSGYVILLLALRFCVLLCTGKRRQEGEDYVGRYTAYDLTFFLAFFFSRGNARAKAACVVFYARCVARVVGVVW